MVEIGSVIQARVVRLESYGAWLKHNTEDVVILIPEISWHGVRHPGDVLAVEDVLDVFVVRYNYKDRVIVGSLKALHPEENPYRRLGRLEPGTVLVGRVASVFGNEAWVDLPGGAYGKIPSHALTEAVYRGDKVEVTIAALEVDAGHLTLNLVRKTNEPAPCPDPVPASRSVESAS